MSDRFHPIPMEQLTRWVYTELAEKDSIFGVPRSAFFVPSPDHRFRLETPGGPLDTPFGVAAGPHTQMAQNIVAAWLAGARVIELKTVQVLDELDVNKPCIDVQDEGYNVEWSQELRIRQSFEEYLRAWVLIHALHRKLGWPGDRPGIVFNMSVGYNLEGIQSPAVQWYLDTMADASAHLADCVDVVAWHDPGVRDVDIPSRLSSTVTLSTMHGCPPDEIERISRYLIDDRGLHTSVKCNPTLLGAERVRGIVNGDLGFVDVPIPDAAFGHDLTWTDAVPMFRNLRAAATARGVAFGLKLSNTLEVENWRGVFERDATMYLSGRPLHAVTVNLAHRIREEFSGDIPISFAGGADCFNVADLLGCGLDTVTVCSDLLKTGGYLRLLQYPEHIDAAFDAAGALDTSDFVARTALRQPGVDAFAAMVGEGASRGAGIEIPEADATSLLDALRAQGPKERAADVVRAWAAGHGRPAERADTVADHAIRALARVNLRGYANAVRRDWRYRKQSFRTDRTKTRRALGAFDCIAAPCVTTCPVDQQVPRYMDAVRRGERAEAARIIRLDNPLPCVLGRVCDHLCETTCVRTHLDQPLAIRHIKRFAMDGGETARGSAAAGSVAQAAPPDGAAPRVAVIGAGPAGVTAALELARAGIAVTVFEARPYAGGMVGSAIPPYRLPKEQLDRDLADLDRLGVDVRYRVTVGVDVTTSSLLADGFRAVFVAAGAQRGKRLGLPGEDADGIVDGITFLRGVHEGHPYEVGGRVGIVGAGDTAMDCARSARRLGATDVRIIYRRTIDQMPADREEIQACLEEGITIVELARPAALHVEDGRLAGLVCTRTEYRGERDSAGRRLPFDVAGSEFEIELDTLVLAISQHTDLALFGADVPELSTAGHVTVDPETLETSIPGVYAGGDVAGAGPASIVLAASDGKRAAAAIGATLGRHGSHADRSLRPVDVPLQMLRRARRQYRVPSSETELGARGGFDETVIGYTPDEAAREASRCLDCADVCSLCVGVCPNLALLTYMAEPVRVGLPVLALRDGTLAATGRTEPFAIEQRPQVAVLTDFCNECGNCVTACPTAGSPYRDKPRLYLDRADFEAQESNAFLLAGGGAMEGRFDGATHRIEVADRIAYTSPAMRAVIDRDGFALLEATPTGAVDGAELSLRPAAVMATLLAGLAASARHLPTVDA